MKMLKHILDSKIRLLDYELLVNDHGTRLVQFSRFAGYGGMIDGLHALGRRLLALGHGNPFLACGMSYMYRCVEDARLDVTRY
jgi:alpha-aminoadipic semialdehyde synthase